MRFERGNGPTLRAALRAEAARGHVLVCSRRKAAEALVDVLGADARTTAAVVLLALVAVEYGGTFLLRVSRGSQPVTPLQQSFFRAGHAHAGVLVVLIWLGAASLAAGRVALGVGLLQAG